MPGGAPPSLPSLPTIPAKGTIPCQAYGCSACCHDNEMLLTEADVKRIRAARPETDFFFRADDGFLQLRTRDGPASKGGVGRPCVFLDPQGRCSIHPIRPEGCRLYPAVWADDLRQAELDSEYCPHTDGFVLTPLVADSMKRLADKLKAERQARTR
jgi:Fe-S-cluster containining protein